MSTLAEKITEALDRYHAGFMQQKVLKTVEEIEATTDPLEKYIAGAGTVNELYNKLNYQLNGCSIEQEGEDFYITGADSVRKKLGDSMYKCPEQGKVFIPSIFLNSYSNLFVLTFGKRIKITFGGNPLKSLTYWYIRGYNFLSDADSDSYGVTENAAVFRYGNYNYTSLVYNTGDGVIADSDKADFVFLSYGTNGGTTFNNVEIEWLDQ